MRRVLRLALCLLAVSPAPAAAQGFFESLFGGSAPAKPAMPPPHPGLPPPLTSPYGYRSPLYSPYRLPSQADPDDQPQSRTGIYRTVCVRMCDGYYWPISHGVPRSSFYRDATVCRASCGEEAKLFYHPASQGDVSEMVDLSGRAYVRLPTAFRYRKALSETCKCKPDPWAQSELDRHRRYALNERVEERVRPLRTAEAPRDPEAVEPRRDTVAAVPPPATVEDESERPDGVARQPEPIVSPRPLPRRSQPTQPAAQKGPPRAPAAVRPTAQPQPFPLFGSSKSRWPGD